MIKVAGYCRVSTQKEDQLNSFASQCRFFESYIGRNPDWQLHEIYADEGVTGTSTRNRTQFNRMMQAAYTGGFQLLLTKEVSRFSRNILDTIAYTRELKALGIGVIFMSDGFSSLDPDAELRLSIMGSIAQEESRKISSRVKWGQTRQMERGVVFGTSMLGYRVENGVMQIVPEEAELVRMIYQRYVFEEKSAAAIASELQASGCRTAGGGTVWSSSGVLKILKNEKYMGDLIQKKTFTPDYLTHKKQYNHGEEPLIALQDHHAPIVSRELWQQAQSKRQLRRRKGEAVSSRHLFSGKIRCGSCGSVFVCRTRKNKNGASVRRWRCLRSVQHGVAGCGIGRLLRDDLALEMLKAAVCMLPQALVQQTVRTVVRACEESAAESAASMMTKKGLLERKKQRALDAYLSEAIDEAAYLSAIAQCDKALQALCEAQEKACCQRETLLQIVRCEIKSEVYFKMLLDHMTVYENGTVELKLQKLPYIWRFQLTR